MKPVKRIISTCLVAALAIVVVALIVIGVFLNHIVKTAVETYGPRLTRTTVSVDTVDLSLLTGSATVKGLAVGNPQGYQMPQSLSVGTIAVGINPMTLFSKKMVIRSIRLEAPDITFEGGLTGNNWSQILDNVNAAGGGGGALSTNAAAPPKSEKKFEVDDLVVTGGKVQVEITGLGATKQQVIPLPDIHLTDLGKGGGITAADLVRRVLSAISSATLEAVAQTASDFEKNSATLREVRQHNGAQIGNALSNLLNK